MVAHSATTSPSAPAPQSGDGRTASPCGDTSSPLPIAHSPLPTSALLNDLTSPHHSLASVAEKHNLTLDDLLLWLALPETREAISLRESAAYSHLRLVASVNLSHAVHTTVKTLETFNTTPRPADPLDPTYLRAAIHARKAAWLLYRFSRLTPLTDDNLAAARRTLRAPLIPDAHARRPESEPMRSSNTQATLLHEEPAPTTSTRPAVPAPDATQHHDLAAARPTSGVPLVPDSDARRHESEPVLWTNTRSTPAQPEQQVQDPPPDMGALLTHLTALAATLGIDLSDLEDPNFDPRFDPTLELDVPAERGSPPEPALAGVAPPDST